MIPRLSYRFNIENTAFRVPGVSRRSKASMEKICTSLLPLDGYSRHFRSFTTSLVPKVQNGGICFYPKPLSRTLMTSPRSNAVHVAHCVIVPWSCSARSIEYRDIDACSTFHVHLVALFIGEECSRIELNVLVGCWPISVHMCGLADRQ